MMKDFNSNSRTLIVSFVVAIMFLVPLRFVEWGNQVMDSRSTQVLGASVMANKVVVLPNAKIESKSMLEAPYNKIEAKCAQKEALIKKLDNSNLTQVEVDEIVTKIDNWDKACLL